MEEVDVSLILQLVGWKFVDAYAVDDLYDFISIHKSKLDITSKTYIDKVERAHITRQVHK